MKTKLLPTLLVALTGATACGTDPMGPEAPGAGPSEPADMIVFSYFDRSNPSELMGIYEITPEGTGMRRLFAPGEVIQGPWGSSGGDSYPRVSPSGDLIALHRIDDRKWNVFVSLLDGSGMRRLTTAVDNSMQPAWSPDGNRIAFVTEPADGRQVLAVARVDGTDFKVLTDGEYAVWNPTWSPDGSQIAFGVAHGITIVDADGSNLRRFSGSVLSGWEYDPAWSPDGRYIAFAKNNARPGTSSSTAPEIVIRSIDGTEEWVVTDHEDSDTAPAWSPDGQRLVYVSNRGELPHHLRIINVDGTGDTAFPGTYRAYAPSWY